MTSSPHQRREARAARDDALRIFSRLRYFLPCGCSLWFWRLHRDHGDCNYLHHQFCSNRADGRCVGGVPELSWVWGPYLLLSVAHARHQWRHNVNVRSPSSSFISLYCGVLRCCMVTLTLLQLHQKGARAHTHKHMRTHMRTHAHTPVLPLLCCVCVLTFAILNPDCAWLSWFQKAIAASR